MSNNTCQECGRWTHFANVGYCSRKCEQQLERFEAYKAYYRNGYERPAGGLFNPKDFRDFES